jgi:hypothetical protein
MEKENKEESKMTDETRIKGVEEILRKNIKSKTLTDDAYNYMALMVNEDAPKNFRELNALIIDFLTDGHSYTLEEGHNFCVATYKSF